MDVVWGLWAPLDLSLVRRNVGRDVSEPYNFKHLGSQHPDLHTMEVAMPTTTEGANGGGVERRGTRGVDERRVASFFLNNQKRVFLFCFVFRGGVWWCLTDFLYSKKKSKKRKKNLSFSI